jgi:site-specific DNA-methyltransferase (adenine-specific)
MEYMRTLPDKAFDLAIVDPPYGIGVHRMNHYVSRKYYSDINDEKNMNELLKNRIANRIRDGRGKLKDRAIQTMNTDWNASPPTKEYFNELFRVSKNQVIWGFNYYMESLPSSRCILCWDKKQSWENFSQFELAWTSFDSPAAIFRFGTTVVAKKDKCKIHPCQNKAIKSLTRTSVQQAALSRA